MRGCVPPVNPLLCTSVALWFSCGVRTASQHIWCPRGRWCMQCVLYIVLIAFKLSIGCREDLIAFKLSGFRNVWLRDQMPFGKGPVLLIHPDTSNTNCVLLWMTDSFIPKQGTEFRKPKRHTGCMRTAAQDPADVTMLGHTNDLLVGRAMPSTTSYL